MNDYLKAVDFLTISKEYQLENEITRVIGKSETNEVQIKSNLYNKEQEITTLRQQGLSYSDAIAALSEKVMKLAEEIELLKNFKKSRK